MVEDTLDHRCYGDGVNDLEQGNTVRAMLQIDVENALELCPAYAPRPMMRAGRHAGG